MLDVEVAQKAVAATTRELAVDYATEADIRDYQKKVRRIMRLLYKYGELPSSFVKRIEKAADIEIISFDPAKALRNDLRWHLRSLFWRPVGDEVLRMLEKRRRSHAHKKSCEYIHNPLSYYNRETSHSNDPNHGL